MWVWSPIAPELRPVEQEEAVRVDFEQSLVRDIWAAKDHVLHTDPHGDFGLSFTTHKSCRTVDCEAPPPEHLPFTAQDQGDRVGPQTQACLCHRVRPVPS